MYKNNVSSFKIVNIKRRKIHFGLKTKENTRAKAKTKIVFHFNQTNPTKQSIISRQFSQNSGVI